MALMTLSSMSSGLTSCISASTSSLNLASWVFNLPAH